MHPVLALLISFGFGALGALSLATSTLCLLEASMPAWWVPAIAVIAGVIAGGTRACSGFYRTLEHELTHIAVGLLFGRVPRELNVTAASGGHVVLAGDTNFFISLAPYYLPLTALGCMVLTAVSSGTIRDYASLGTLAALGYHGAAIALEFTVEQTDIARHSAAFSATVITGLLGTFGSIIAAYALNGANGVVGWQATWIRIGCDLLHGISPLVPAIQQDWFA